MHQYLPATLTACVVTLVAIATPGHAATPPAPALPPILITASETITRELSAVDRAVAETAAKLSATGLTNAAARALLAGLQAAQSNVIIDACTISPKGIMLAVEPAAYRSVEGTDISGQEQVKAIGQNHKPVMSRVFKTVEGIEAVDIEHPVIAADGTFMGSVSVIFKPSVFIGKVVPGVIAGIPVEIWAMQPDGRILYDADTNEIGRMLFTDPIYKPFATLLRLGRRIATEPEGVGSYTFFQTGSTNPIRKDASWVSPVLHRTEWRLVMTHKAGERNSQVKSGAPAFSDDALRALARDPALVAALAAADQAAILKRFRQEVLTHSEIYSLTWIDAVAVNRCGYPPENSLLDVDLHKLTDISSMLCVAAIAGRKEAVCEDTLLEGGRARFVIVPVLDGQKPLGALLWIRRK